MEVHIVPSASDIRCSHASRPSSHADAIPNEELSTAGAGQACVGRGGRAARDEEELLWCSLLRAEVLARAKYKRKAVMSSAVEFVVAE